ncbi:hypothetical protein [Propionicicella superfundia]|uniref:hypothetical protein n=1 Tax=Propionicicella superfundia TaxID=348582 RepID=UPI0003F9BF81|nr:hypothetical protein [Propionicicella superfundia]
MTFDIVQHLFWLIAALGGGFFGAAIGGNFSFVITGFTALMALGAAAIPTTTGDPGAVSATVFGYLAFGPFTGPHVAFGGAVAGAAYAAHKGYTESGKDIVLPLARLGKPDVLLVGALFGGIGYIIQQIYANIPWFGTHTDSVAVTVVTSALIVRAVFGKNATDPEHGSSLVNFEKRIDGLKPRDDAAWLRHMETPGQLVPLGFFAGLLAAGAALYLAFTFPGIAGNANVFPFAISAVTILFLNIGYNIPVTHHITNIAGLGAIMFFPIFLGNAAYGPKGFDPTAFAHALTTDSKMAGAAIGALIVGALFGVMAAFLGEFGARLLYNRGTTHIDPPAFAIFISNTIVWVVALIVQAAAGIGA